MKKKQPVEIKLLIILLLAVALLSVILPPKPKDNKNATNGISLKKELADKSKHPTPIKEKCLMDYETYPVEKKLFNNKEAIRFVKDSCMMVFDAKKSDLENNGREDNIILVVSSYCASCHWQTVYVLSGSKVIFEKGFTHPAIQTFKRDYPGSNSDGRNVFSINEALYKQDEGFCCPTNGLTTSYDWSDGTFYPFDQRPSKPPPYL